MIPRPHEFNLITRLEIRSHRFTIEIDVTVIPILIDSLFARLTSESLFRFLVFLAPTISKIQRQSPFYDALNILLLCFMDIKFFQSFFIPSNLLHLYVIISLLRVKWLKTLHDTGKILSVHSKKERNKTKQQLHDHTYFNLLDDLIMFAYSDLAFLLEIISYINVRYFSMSIHCFQDRNISLQ